MAAQRMLRAAAAARLLFWRLRQHSWPLFAPPYGGTRLWASPRRRSGRFKGIERRPMCQVKRRWLVSPGNCCCCPGDAQRTCSISTISELKAGISLFVSASFPSCCLVVAANQREQRKNVDVCWSKRWCIGGMNAECKNEEEFVLKYLHSCAVTRVRLSKVQSIHNCLFYERSLV